MGDLKAFTMQRFLNSLRRSPPRIARCLGSLVVPGKGTIYACSSGTGPAGVAVIRLSGPDSSTALKLMTNTESLPQAKYMEYKKIIHPETKEVIDKGYIVWIPGPKSYTGEDCVELQVHGSVAVVHAIFDALSTIKNLRYADAGEFTKRAYFNSKMDLTAAEGIADLILAETEMQRKQAFLQSQGSLRIKYNRWKDILIELRADVEAMIEFGETDGVTFDSFSLIKHEVTEIKNEVRAHIEDSFRGERLRSGVKTAIVGNPNVGKSSLINHLSQRSVSIVSNIRNTTRDIVETAVDIGGYPVIIADTAGLEDVASGPLEQLAQAKSIDYVRVADLILLVIDMTKIRIPNEDNLLEYVKNFFSKNNIEVNEKAKKLKDLFTKPCIIVLNKCDLVDMNEVDQSCEDRADIVFVSCKTEGGLLQLNKLFEKKLSQLVGVPTMENASCTNSRHKLFLHPVQQHLEEFLIKLNVPDLPLDLMAEDLRMAVRALGALTGHITNNQIMDVVFSKFCIGK